MERNQQTTMSNLVLGDRFYKVNDNTNVMWEVTGHGKYHNRATNGKESALISKTTQVLFISHQKNRQSK